MRKIINPGTINNKEVFIEIIYEYNILSFTGVIGPNDSDCISGQIDDILNDQEIVYHDNWLAVDIQRLKKIWKQSKIKSMVLGSPKQEAFIKDNQMEDAPYEDIVNALIKIDLFYDKSYLYHGEPYQYASAWLDNTISEEDMNWLDDLPEAKKEPEWI